MELTSAPPPGGGAGRSDAAAATGPEAPLPAPLAAAPAADRVDIQPLTEAAALQILIAEVRTELQLPFELPQARSVAHTAQIVLDLMLRALPDESVAIAPRELEAVTKIDAALAAALDRAVMTVAGWRNVPPAAVEGVRETRMLIATLLQDEPPSAVWGRPEWEWLAPRMQDYWRRRRRRRSGRDGSALSDPDLARAQVPGDDHREPTAE